MYLKKDNGASELNYAYCLFLHLSEINRNTNRIHRFKPSVDWWLL